MNVENNELLNNYINKQTEKTIDVLSTTKPFATSIAAGAESLFRSATNSILNNKLGGAKLHLFPNMHIQMPTRIMYINGFKIVKESIEGSFLQEIAPSTARVLSMIAPGVILAPLVSLLEASTLLNKGANSGSLFRTSKAGFAPRCLREVFFGIGINNFSKFFVDRLTVSVGDTMGNILGSIVAGALAGYLSHLPHLVSTMKMMHPTKTYSDVAKLVIAKSGRRFEKFFIVSILLMVFRSKYKRLGRKLLVSERARLVLDLAYVGLFPRFFLIRCSQICGSFIIINTISKLVSEKLD